jgi:hypothetical protein
MDTITAPIITPDHDLLIEMRTELKGMREELKSFSNDTKERLIRVEERKMEKQDFADFFAEYKSERADKERRLRFLERWIWAGIGIVACVEFAIIAYIGYFHR